MYLYNNYNHIFFPCYHTNLIQLSALGTLKQSNKDCATEDNNQDFVRGSLTELMFIFNFFGRRGIRLVPAQDVHFFYMRSHLSALQNCALLFSTNF